MSARRYSSLTTFEIEDALLEAGLVIPVGTIEQHGPHLPLSVDLDLAFAFAEALAERTDRLLAEPITYGARSLPQSGGGPSFAGTIRIRGDVLIHYLSDVIEGYLDAGARNVAIVNGHYENEPFLFEALEQCRERGKTEGVRILALSWWSAVEDALIAELFGDSFPGWHAEHAGLTETSLMMHLHPDKVTTVDIDHPTPPLAGVYRLPVDDTRASTRGVLSTTRGASSTAGQAIFEHVCARMFALADGSDTALRPRP